MLIPAGVPDVVEICPAASTSGRDAATSGPRRRVLRHLQARWKRHPPLQHRQCEG